MVYLENRINDLIIAGVAESQKKAYLLSRSTSSRRKSASSGQVAGAVLELADKRVSKTRDMKISCGFDSHPRYIRVRFTSPKF